MAKEEIHEQWLHKAYQLVSLVMIVVGIMGVSAWAFGLDAMKSFWTGRTMVRPNTAILFIASGLAFALETSGWPHPKKILRWIARLLACGVVAIALLTGLEYLLRSDLGIDTLFLGSSAMAIATRRMSSNSVVAFLLVGAALWVWSVKVHTRKVCRLTGILGLAAALLGFGVVLSNLVDLSAPPGEWTLTRMALIAGILFFIVGATLFLMASREGGLLWALSRKATFGFACGLALLIAISMISYKAASVVIETSGAVTQAQKMMKEIRDISFVIEASDADELRFIMSGDPQFRSDIRADHAPIDKEIQDVWEMTKDDPIQRRRVEQLRQVVEQKRDYVRKLIAMRENGAVEQATSLQAVRESDRLLDQTRTILSTMIDEEMGLLQIRNGRANQFVRFTFFILPIGTIVTTTVMLIVIFFFNEQATQRRQAEEQVRRWNEQLDLAVKTRTTELEAALRELESFSYSVAHDLRAPVRAVSGYSEIMAADYAAKLPEDGLNILTVICKEARRMGQLIDDLLAFSRLGRQRMELSRVNMHLLANAVFAELSGAVRNKKIEFQLHPLADALGDSSMLRQVWVNLLSNAIKFSSQRELPRIEIGCRTMSNQITYFVRDNGAGFDMRYADKLFNVFQRLHSEEEFSGTGVGLALSQRIIHRHGGEIWAEGKADQGATFYFSLPVAEANTNGSNT